MSEFSFEQAIGAMLQDPEQMQKIFALAQSLGFSPPAAQGASSPPEPPVSPPPTPKQETSPPDDRQQALGELLQKAGKLDRRQENLLNALKPFLKPERPRKNRPRPCRPPESRVWQAQRCAAAIRKSRQEGTHV